MINRLPLMAWIFFFSSIMLASSATVTLTVVGTPATGPWGVEGKVTDTRDVMADIMLDGVLHHTEHSAPYGFPTDNGITASTGTFGVGAHTVEFIFKLEGTATEIGRTSIAVVEGLPPAVPGPPGAPVVTLKPSPIVGSALLGWQANTESDLAGYRVYLGTASRTYTSFSTLPKTQITATANNLAPGKTYYFAVTAFDLAGNESPFSNEVQKTIP